MKKYSIIILLLFVGSYCVSQTLSRHSISCMGNTESTSDMTLRQTVGQSGNTETFTKESGVIRQGFQQPLSMVRIVTPQAENLEISVYPNPFKDDLFLSILGGSENYRIKVVDITGKIVLDELECKSIETKVDCTNWNPGSYFIILSNGSNIVAKEKIVKIN